MKDIQKEISTLQELIAKAKEKEVRLRDEFIRIRTKHEAIIQTFSSGIESVDPSLIEHIDLPASLTAQDLFPSLYAKPFNPKEYNKELKAFQNIQSQLSSVLLSLIQKSKQAMEDYLHE